jgi:hypothetical protein
MPKYRVLEKSFINNTIVEEGAIITYTGTASRNLELLADQATPTPAVADDVPPPDSSVPDGQPTPDAAAPAPSKKGTAA